MLNFKANVTKGFFFLILLSHIQNAYAGFNSPRYEASNLPKTSNNSVKYLTLSTIDQNGEKRDFCVHPLNYDISLIPEFARNAGLTTNSKDTNYHQHNRLRKCTADEVSEAQYVANNALGPNNEVAVLGEMVAYCILTGATAGTLTYFATEVAKESEIEEMKKITPALAGASSVAVPLSMIGSHQLAATVAATAALASKVVMTCATAGAAAGYLIATYWTDDK